MYGGNPIVILKLVCITKLNTCIYLVCRPYYVLIKKLGACIGMSLYS